MLASWLFPRGGTQKQRRWSEVLRSCFDLKTNVYEEIEKRLETVIPISAISNVILFKDRARVLGGRHPLMYDVPGGGLGVA